MRIICWNMQSKGSKDKLGVNDKNLSLLMDKWAGGLPTLYIFLEPSQSLLDVAANGTGNNILGSRTSDRPARHGITPSWRIVSYIQGFYQGRVCVAYQEGTTVVLSGESLAVVPGSGQDDQDNHLVFIKVTRGDQTLQLATCHTPCGKDFAKAGDYMSRAASKLCEPYRLPVTSKPGDPPLAKKPKLTNTPMVDIWLGDFNVDSLTVPTEATNYFKTALALPTSGYGSGANVHKPLDKIFVRPLFQYGRCGRIMPMPVALAEKEPAPPAKKHFKPSDTSKKDAGAENPLFRRSNAWKKYAMMPMSRVPGRFFELDDLESLGPAGRTRGVLSLAGTTEAFDCTESNWTCNADVGSDHIPIYIETCKDAVPIGWGSSGSNSNSSSSNNSSSNNSSPSNSFFAAPKPKGTKEYKVESKDMKDAKKN